MWERHLYLHKGKLPIASAGAQRKLQIIVFWGDYLLLLQEFLHSELCK